MTDVVQEIFTDRIDDPQDAMRTDMDRDALWDLAEDIKKNGLINPITVRPIGDRFEVVAGHRRITACKIAGLIKVPCVVRDLSDDAAFSVMVSENLVRSDVDPDDEAVFVAKLLEKHSNDIHEVASIMRRSPEWVRDRVAVFNMPEYIRIPLKEGKLKLGVALALAQIKNDGTREMWTRQAVRDGITVAIAKYWLAQSELEPEDNSGVPTAPPQEFMLRCSLDDKQYNAKLFRSVLVYEGNMQYIDALRGELIAASGVVSEIDTPN